MSWRVLEQGLQFPAPAQVAWGTTLFVEVTCSGLQCPRQATPGARGPGFSTLQTPQTKQQKGAPDTSPPEQHPSALTEAPVMPSGETGPGPNLAPITSAQHKPSHHEVKGEPEPGCTPRVRGRGAAISQAGTVSTQGGDSCQIL